MNLTEIKKAIADKKTVFWSNENYEVILDNIGQYLIHSKFNNHYIGLTHLDNKTLNGKESEFYVKENKLQNIKKIMIEFDRSDKKFLKTIDFITSIGICEFRVVYEDSINIVTIHCPYNSCFYDYCINQELDYYTEY